MKDPGRVSGPHPHSLAALEAGPSRSPPNPPKPEDHVLIGIWWEFRAPRIALVPCASAVWERRQTDGQAGRMEPRASRAFGRRRGRLGAVFPSWTRFPGLGQPRAQ